MSGFGGGVNLAGTPYDYGVEVRRGNIPGVSAIDKFGRSFDVDDSVFTDIVSSANGIDPLWVAPTQIQPFSIVSTLANDTLLGTGARRLQVSYLPDWDTPEVRAIVDMNGTTPVITPFSGVIVHRVKVVDFGTNGSNFANEGRISVTAQTDATLVAEVRAGRGQTQMAIYGVPSVQMLQVNYIKVGILRANLSTQETHIDLRLLVAEDPANHPNVYIEKDSDGVGSRGFNPAIIPYNPAKVISGPAIVKIQAASSASNTDVSAGFDAYVIDK